MTLKLPAEAQKIINKMKKAGFECYAVGGSVRDLLMGNPTKNWDFTTNATPEQIQEIFPDSYYENKFGTVGIPLETKNQGLRTKDREKELYEITTYRTEWGYEDKRHPTVVKWGKSLEEDLARRDFTINAIATDGKEIIDPYNGQKDIQEKIIKAVRDPKERFSEDALRMMRAIRVATELQFLIDPLTFEAIKQNSHLIKQISGERIRDELVKILKSDHPADGMLLLHNSGLLVQISPEIEKGYGLSQAGHHIYDVFKHSLESLRFCPSKNWLVRLATFLHDIGKPVVVKYKEGKPTFYNHEVVGAAIVKNIANSLHFGRFDREKLYILVRWHMFSVSEFLTDAAIRRFIRRVGKENVNEIMDLRIGDRLGGGCLTETSWRLRKLQQRVIEVQKHVPSVNDLKVDGNDVMKTLGIRPGPKVGQVLNQLFEEVIEDPKKNNRDYLLKRIKEL